MLTFQATSFNTIQCLQYSITYSAHQFVLRRVIKPSKSSSHLNLNFNHHFLLIVCKRYWFIIYYYVTGYELLKAILGSIIIMVPMHLGILPKTTSDGHNSTNPRNLWTQPFEFCWKLQLFTPTASRGQILLSQLHELRSRTMEWDYHL